MRQKSFTILTTFTLLLIIGLALLPQLELSLLPGRSKPSITVVYNMLNAGGEVIDAEITTPMEGVFSTLSGLVELKSKTGKGAGHITLTFDKEVDMDAMRFQVSALIRQLRGKLPKQMSAPRIYTNDPDDQEAENLLIYAINGQGDKQAIHRLIESTVVPSLAEINGVHQVSLSGLERQEWHLYYEANKLEQVGISISDISNAFRSHYFDYSLGMVNTSQDREGQKKPLVFSGYARDELAWENITLTKQGRVFYLKDLVKVVKEREKPRSYVRINGLNTIYLYVSSAKGANQLRCGAEVKKSVALLQQQLSDVFVFSETYDATVFIKDEVSRIALRIGLSLVLLLLFVFLANRSWRYMLITLVSILINLTLAFIFYYLFHIQIHVYSMAGITVSLGIIIDNTIVMTDHLKHKQDRRVFLPILASTLTTIGSLLIVFFLSEEQKLQLIDFAYVISINLIVSLLVALFFIPAMVEKMSLYEQNKAKPLKIRRRILRFTNFYERFILLCKRRKAIFVILIVLLFGFPMSRLPLTMEGDGLPTNAYNNTLGSEWYGKHLKKPVNVALGGFLNPFLTKVKHRFSNGGNRKTQLNIRGSMPQGATLKQMNTIFLKIENFLAQYDGLEQYITRIHSPHNGRMSITFTPEEEFGSLPFTVKDEVQSFCVDIGPVDWDITGVGRGFDNSLNEAYRNSRIILYGYNLEQLKRYAFSLKEELEKIPRVEKVFVNGKESYMDRIAYEYALRLKDRTIAHQGMNSGQVIDKARRQVSSEETIFHLYDEAGSNVPLIMKKEQAENSKWDFFNQKVSVDDKQLKMNAIAWIQKQRAADYINKINMEYQLVVEFDFIGSYGQKKYILDELIADFLPHLPIGYRLESQRYSGGRWGSDDHDKRPVLWLLVILAVIYMICAVLLESLVQPFAVILTIPISFIGVFITFFAFKLPFGDGGYAAMLLLSGLTVNSALYLINEYNNQKNKEYLKAYLKAYNQKIIPILLTICSTMLGLVPFLFGGGKDPFWFSLAAGTIGGLAFSLCAVWVYLPLFLRLKVKQSL